MGFLLAVLGFVVAEEVVELEPVTALYDNYPCDYWTGKANGETNCKKHPWCYYAASACRFDGCLMAADDGWTTDNDCKAANNDNASCHYYVSTIPYVDDAACTNPNTPVLKYRKVCRYGNDQGNPVDSCTFEYLKSGKTTCDKWLCRAWKDEAGKDYCATNSPPDANLGSSCPSILDKDWCSLSPKCYWSSGACVQDYCTKWGSDCDTHYDDVADANTATKCTSFQIFDGSKSDSTQTKLLCVNPSKNAAPNKCYDLGAYSATNHPSTGSGLCTTYTLPKCSANAECTAQFPTSGPFAGYYCADATHSSHTVLAHVPYLLLLLLVAFFAF